MQVQHVRYPIGPPRTEPRRYRSRASRLTTSSAVAAVVVGTGPKTPRCRCRRGHAAECTCSNCLNRTPGSGIGAARCAVANRISHVLDLHGPSLAVDTACSASLVALHLACQSLRSAESGSPSWRGEFAPLPWREPSPGSGRRAGSDGRSKAFERTADGYGRGEGCGVVVLSCWPTPSATATGCWQSSAVAR